MRIGDFTETQIVSASIAFMLEHHPHSVFRYLARVP